MTKFAMIKTTHSYETAKLNAFKKKFTASNLKKRLKCKEVIELKNVKYEAKILESITQIDQHTFADLVNQLSNFNILDMRKNNWRMQESQKYFAFSDDVDNTSKTFERIKNEALITFFEVDEVDVDTFIENIENIISCSDSIEEINQAKEALETLQNYEQEFSVKLTSYDAEDELDSLTQNLESEIEDMNDQLSDCLMWS